MMSDDARDLNAARAGDQAAFARLYDRHAGVVLSLCRRRRPDGAEDALQETFLRAFRMLDQVESADGLRRWLYAIARRVCSELSRSARRRTHHEAAAMTQLRAATIASGNGHPAGSVPASVTHTEELERLGAALDELPDEERLAIHLFYLESDPAAAASAALGLSRSGFYKLLSRARQRLADRMREATIHE
jgi:RNA polymerase sigma-70 factor (ECF subfamily)